MALPNWPLSLLILKQSRHEAPSVTISLPYPSVAAILRSCLSLRPGTLQGPIQAFLNRGISGIRCLASASFLAAMANITGAGIARTASGRKTYRPDGLPDQSAVPEFYFDFSTSTDALPTLQPSSKRTVLRRSYSPSGTSFRRESENTMTLDHDSMGEAGGNRQANTHFAGPIAANGAGYNSDDDVEKQEHDLDKEEEGLERHHGSQDNIEKQKSGARQEQKEGEGKDPNLIEWNGPDDPENPENWSSIKKWGITTVTGGIVYFI